MTTPNPVRRPNPHYAVMRMTAEYIEGDRPAARVEDYAVAYARVIKAAIGRDLASQTAGLLTEHTATAPSVDAMPGEVADDALARLLAYHLRQP